jgi:hypothetical protein
VEENTYVGITLIRGFYVNDTKEVRRAGDPSSSPSSGENFPLKLTTYVSLT